MSFQFVADKEKKVVHRYDCAEVRAIRRRNVVIVLCPEIGYEQHAVCLGAKTADERAEEAA